MTTAQIILQQLERLCKDDQLLIATILEHGALVDYDLDCATMGFWVENPLVRAAWERAIKEKEGEK